MVALFAPYCTSLVSTRQRDRTMILNSDVKTSTGNVFADLGFINSDEMLVKAELARQISAFIAARNITQADAAKLLGIDQPKISALMKGKLTGFSLERMFRYLNTLGNDIEITIKPKSSNDGRISVVC